MVGELKAQLGTHTSATEFSGYVEQLPPVKPSERLVLSQVLVPPLANEYSTVKEEWMQKKLWREEPFIQVMGDSCSEEVEASVIQAVLDFLDLHMDKHIKDMKYRKDQNWKRHLVESFETSLHDPPVSSNVEKYTVPDTDPTEALRGQLGLRTVSDSEIFVVGVYRSRTMLELPTYTEHERTNTPAGFQKSPYWWGLELDRYAVDGTLFCPEWMSDGPVCQKGPARKKKDQAKKGQATMWSEGYTMVHSAFGYGNETVLCNDPHAQPYTCLDDTEAVEHARNSSNIHVKICRIGPWVFPVEVTTRFLPKGSPLLFFYGREYWITNRASLALATLADAREDKLRQENEALQSRLHQMQQQQAEATHLLLQANAAASQIFGSVEGPQMDIGYCEPCSKPVMKQEPAAILTPSNHLAAGSNARLSSTQETARALALGMPCDATSNIDTNQSLFGSQIGPLNTAVTAPLGSSFKNAGFAGDIAGQSGDGPGLYSSALGAVQAEVTDLQRALGSMLQRANNLEFKVQEMGQNPYASSQLEGAVWVPQHAQHAAKKIDDHRSSDTPHSQANLPAVRNSNSAAVHLLGNKLQSTPSTPGHKSGQTLKLKLNAHAAEHRADVPTDSDQCGGLGSTLVPVVKQALVVAAGEDHALTAQDSLANDGEQHEAGLNEEGQLAARLSRKKRKSRGVNTAQGDSLPEAQHGSEQKKAQVARKKKKAGDVDDAAPKKRKNRKVDNRGAEGFAVEKNTEVTTAVASEDEEASSQSDEEAAGLQWGGKQKRKHRRVPAPVVPTHPSDQSSGETTAAAATAAAEGLVESRCHTQLSCPSSQAAEARNRYNLGADKMLAPALEEEESLTPTQRFQNSRDALIGQASRQPCQQPTQELLTKYYKSDSPLAVASSTAGTAATAAAPAVRVDCTNARGVSVGHGTQDSPEGAPRTAFAASHCSGAGPVTADIDAAAAATAATAAKVTAACTDATAAVCPASGGIEGSGVALYAATAALPVAQQAGSGGEYGGPVDCDNIGATAAAGGGADDADVGAGVQESGQVTEGAAGTSETAILLNSKDSRFVPTEDAKVNVSPEGAEPLQVRRRIIAPEGDHGHRYLIAKDILKACGVDSHKPSKTVKSWINRANRSIPTCLPRQAYWSGASNWTFVFGADDIQSLMMSGVLSDEQRQSLHLFTSDIWTVDEQSQRADEGTEGPDGSSPEAGEALGADAGRASDSNPVHEAAFRAVDGSPERQPKQSGASSGEHEAGSGNNRATPEAAVSTATRVINARAEAEKDATEAAVASEPDPHRAAQGGSCSRYEQAVHIIAGSSGHRCGQDNQRLPEADSHGPDGHEGRAGASLSPVHMFRQPHAITPQISALHAAPASVSGSICDGPALGSGGGKNQTTLGRRKKARKSTQTVLQPAISVQQSNQALQEQHHRSEGNDSAPDVKPRQLDLGSDNIGSKAGHFAADDVIDLT